MRTKMKILRITNKLTQKQMADKIGVKRATYSAVECGARNGKHDFWINIQAVFNVPETEMWELMKNEP